SLLVRDYNSLHRAAPDLRPDGQKSSHYAQNSAWKRSINLLTAPPGGGSKAPSSDWTRRTPQSELVRSSVPPLLISLCETGRSATGTFSALANSMRVRLATPGRMPLVTSGVTSPSPETAKRLLFAPSARRPSASTKSASSQPL